MNKYLRPKRYIQLGKWLLNTLFLDPIELLFVPGADRPLRYPPIFFVGAPRSGSTLMMQAITDALDLGYISNLHCRWYGAPVLAERIFRPTDLRPCSTYRSEHGETKGLFAPAECGEWWYRFFRRTPKYVPLDAVKTDRMRRFRQSIAGLTNAFDKPVLFKNLYASLRIQAIAHYVPESLFIIISRDEVDNAHSLLETRHRVHQDYQRWWSMEPPEIDALRGLPAHEQVVEQIRCIEDVIKRDLNASNVARSRQFFVSYEDFCAHPRSVIDQLREFISINGCYVKRTGTIPAQFKTRSELRIDRSVYDEMVRYANDR